MHVYGVELCYSIHFHAAYHVPSFRTRYVYDRMAKRGYWVNWLEVHRYFIKSENNAAFRYSPLHGTGGPLHVSNPAEDLPLVKAFVQGFSQVAVALLVKFPVKCIETVSLVFEIRGNKVGTSKCFRVSSSNVNPKILFNTCMASPLSERTFLKRNCVTEEASPWVFKLLGGAQYLCISKTSLFYIWVL